MKLQVLISTMNQTDHSLLKKMNIRSDAIVINQCDRNCIEKFMFRGFDILWMSLDERGVGLSRNNALMRASGDILLFADDDVVYSDDYVEKITKLFNSKKEGLIVFNLKSLNPRRPEMIVGKEYKLHWYNCLKFGAFRIAIRRNQIQKLNVYFSLLFGGGAKYQSGEDTLFIIQCLKNGMKGLASNIMIGTVQQRQSTWFKDFDEKYFFDKGVLMKECFGYMSKVLLLALYIKNIEQTKKICLINALKCAFKGCDSI
jgi:glycosyltransferase involved in cell wall biosynthesis